MAWEPSTAKRPTGIWILAACLVIALRIPFALRLELTTVADRPSTSNTQEALPASSSPSLLLLPLSEIHDRSAAVGSWIGNAWIPNDGWSIRSLSRLRQDFAPYQRLVMAGDSTGRRGALGLYEMLKDQQQQQQQENGNNTLATENMEVKQLEHWSVVDVNKKGSGATESCALYNSSAPHPTPLICRSWSEATTTNENKADNFLYLSIRCHTELEALLQAELTGRSRLLSSSSSDRQQTLLVVAIGLWESLNKVECRDGRRSVTAKNDDTMILLEQMLAHNPHLVVVWRTSGFQQQRSPREDFIRHLNHHAIDNIRRINHPNLLYVDWGDVIRPRSFGKKRIEGDLDVHYGWEARFVFHQMLANLLHDRSNLFVQ